MMGDTFSGSMWLLLLLQSTACLGAGLLASYLLRDRPARAHQALLTALLASVLMPGLYLLVKHFNLGALTAEAAFQPQETVETPVFTVAEAVEEMTAEFEDEAALAPTADIPPSSDATKPSYGLLYGGFARAARLGLSIPWQAGVLVCWAAAATVLLGRLAARFILGLHLLRTARPLQSECLQEALAAARDGLGVRRQIRLRCSEKVRSPIIWCWARAPVLLVHAGAAERPSRADWVSIFCHELAHLRRLDHLSGVLAEVLTALLPWQPLLWWAKDRLARLSEQACDDWALAGGQIGVDYAEALLALVPQRPMALLPTVAGKEKAMKERIRRIVRDSGGNPRIGLRWAAAVSVLAVLAAVGVAVAQRRPAAREREEPRQQERPALRDESPGPRPAVIGRRNVLLRLREQLENQARETENVLRERGDEAGEEGRVLRAELETLHQQIELVNRQLAELERGPQPPERARMEEQRAPEQAQQRERLNERLRDLRARGQEIQRNLEERPDMPPERADALRQELREIREQAGATERELQELNRRPEELGRERLAGVARARRPGAAETPELEGQREWLATSIRQSEQLLAERCERGEGEGPEATKLRRRLEVMRAAMAALEARSRGERPRVERPPIEIGRRPAPAPEGERGRLQAEVNELREQMNGLREQMQQMQRMLEQLARQRAAE
jgi:beta-lactamase regulating signal transducer with metallopeptidase domain